MDLNDSVVVNLKHWYNMARNLCVEHWNHVKLVLKYVVILFLGMCIVLRYMSSSATSHTQTSGTIRNVGTRRNAKTMRNIGGFTTQYDTTSSILTEEEAQSAVEATEYYRQQVRMNKEGLRIIYNRVPKCGSRSVLKVFMRLAEMGGFSWNHSPNVAQLRMTTEQQVVQVDAIYKIQAPMIFDRHMYFINFTEFTGMQNPLYINVVRDPLEQYQSMYYYLRLQAKKKDELFTEEERKMSLDECISRGYTGGYTTGHDRCGDDYITYIIPFFCGHSDSCRVPGHASLQTAKHHVTKYYATIGLLEDLPNFFRTLEYVFPAQFATAQHIYQTYSKRSKMKKGMETKGKIKPKESTIKTLLQKLKYEIDFYNFVKQRFYHVLQHINRNSNRTNT